MSTEKSVRVRVKVYDNTTSIYSQDIEITNGEGTFTVPAILADSDVIALQVRITTLNRAVILQNKFILKTKSRTITKFNFCKIIFNNCRIR